MDGQQKERLEQELRFLGESLEADVISRDEYERGKERIERKIRELEKQPEGEKSEEEKEKPEEESKPQEEAEEKPATEEQLEEEEAPREKDEPEEETPEPKIEIKEIKEKPTKIIGIEDEPMEDRVKRETEKPEKEDSESEVEKEETKEEKKPEDSKEPEEEEIKVSKKWIYGLAIIIIAAILFFSIRSCGKQEETPLVEELTPECYSNADCNQQGMIGTCLSPSTEEAKCEFKQDAETDLIVINDQICSLCDPSNTKNIVKEIFPNVNIKEIDYKTEEAKKLVADLGIDALPAYIFDSKIEGTANFEDFKTALAQKKENYLITNTASGAVYYFKRPLIKNKLDLYVLPDTDGKMDSSMQEVLNLFKDKINITKHIVTDSQKGLLEKELAINTFPSFLLDNQIKFKGVLPANMIKENICQVNYFKECEKELSKI